jgi:hypothetical protein
VVLMGAGLGSGVRRWALQHTDVDVDAIQKALLPQQ